LLVGRLSYRLLELRCSPQGHLFDKECIYEALLHQKKALKRQRRLWKEQNMKLKEEEMAKERAKRTALLTAFERTETALLPAIVPTSVLASTETMSRAPVSTTTNSATTLSSEEPPPRPAQLAQNTEERSTQLTAYWVPALTPTAPPTPISKPSKTTYCLEGKHPLTLKELIPVHFTVVPTSSLDKQSTSQNSKSEIGSGEGGDGDVHDEASRREYMCPLCTKTLNNVLRAVLLRGCGHVLCVHCTQQFVVPSKVCAVCNEPCASENDRIFLQTGGTGYAGHDQERLQAVKKTPAPWI
jgi:nitric oxide synthase-interacting protein